MRRRPGKAPRWLAAGAAALVATAAGATTEYTVTADPVGAWAAPLELGPVPGLTTGWHPAPTELAVPLGTVLTFRQFAGEETTVVWHGAVEIARDATSSTAECPLDETGSQTVQVEMTRPGGTAESRSVRIEVIDVPAAALAVDRVDVHVDPIELDETATNEETMAAFFAPSIARLELREHRAATSIERPLELRAVHEGIELAALVEWRIDGEPVALGPELGHPGFPEVGRFVVEAGPPDRASAIEIDIYEVHVAMTSHPEGTLPRDGEPVSFVAQTVPRGFEEQVRWLSSTKFGTATPVLGEGPEFTAVYEDTVGPGQHGNTYRWFGAKADNATMEADARVAIRRADVCGDSIEIGLVPRDSTGQFTLTLSGPGGTVTLVNEQRSGGTHLDRFGFATLPTDREYTTLTATWDADGMTSDDTETAHFMVLGNFRHTQYNCPSESHATCSGAPTDVCFTDAACDYDEGTLPSTFVTQVSDPAFGTGCGQTVDHGDIQVEAFCLSRFPPPPECQGDAIFRENTTITPACTGGGLGDDTVAASPGNLGGRLPCGAQVCISPGATGIVKTVSDRCPACAANQLDNFSTAGSCGILDFCASCLTLELF